MTDMQTRDSGVQTEKECATPDCINTARWYSIYETRELGHQPPKRCTVCCDLIAQGELSLPIPGSRRLVLEEMTDDDKAAWRDAWYIAWIGASNPRGVQNSIKKHTMTVGSEHSAVRAMRYHFHFLLGEGLGPNEHLLRLVEEFGLREGLGK